MLEVAMLLTPMGLLEVTIAVIPVGGCNGWGNLPCFHDSHHKEKDGLPEHRIRLLWKQKCGKRWEEYLSNMYVLGSRALSPDALLLFLRLRCSIFFLEFLSNYLICLNCFKIIFFF